MSNDSAPGGRVSDALGHRGVVAHSVVVPPTGDVRIGGAQLVDQRRRRRSCGRRPASRRIAADRGRGEVGPVDDALAGERVLEQVADERPPRLQRAAEHRAQQRVARQHLAAMAEQQHRDVVERGHQPQQPGIGPLLRPPAPPGDGAAWARRGRAGGLARRRRAAARGPARRAPRPRRWAGGPARAGCSSRGSAPASTASSSRRRPGTRRGPGNAVMPAWAGVSRSRRERRNAPSAARSRASAPRR